MISLELLGKMVYYMPNCFFFVETVIDNNIHETKKDDFKVINLKQNNIFESKNNKYKTIIALNSINFSYLKHIELHKNLKKWNIANTGNKFSYSIGNYLLEYLSSFLSLSYIRIQNKTYGLYWGIDLFDIYTTFHDDKNKCRRGLIGGYIGFRHSYINTKNITIWYNIGIGVSLQRYYSLCAFNRVINYKDQKICDYNSFEYHNKNDKLPTNNTTFNLLEIFTNLSSYLNFDIIFDIGLLNLIHKNGFFLNINLKIGLLNTYNIFKSKNKNINKFLGIMHNLSISIGYDISKILKKQTNIAN